MLLVSLPETESEGEGLRFSSTRLSLVGETGSDAGVSDASSSLTKNGEKQGSNFVKLQKYGYCTWIFFLFQTVTYRRHFTPYTFETLLQSECCCSHPLDLFLLLHQKLPFFPRCFIGFLESLDLSLWSWKKKDEKVGRDWYWNHIFRVWCNLGLFRVKYLLLLQL